MRVPPPVPGSGSVETMVASNRTGVVAMAPHDPRPHRQASTAVSPNTSMPSTAAKMLRRRVIWPLPDRPAHGSTGALVLRAHSESRSRSRRIDPIEDPAARSPLGRARVLESVGNERLAGCLGRTSQLGGGDRGRWPRATGHDNQPRGALGPLLRIGFAPGLDRPSGEPTLLDGAQAGASPVAESGVAKCRFENARPEPVFR